MKHKQILTFGIIVCLVTLVYSVAEANFTRLVSKIRPAVVTVVVYDAYHNVSGIGSGFFVDKYGHLITNYHVIDGKYAAEVKTADGNSYPVAMVVAENKSVDLVKVLVDIPREKVKWIKVAEIDAIGGNLLIIDLGYHFGAAKGIFDRLAEQPGKCQAEKFVAQEVEKAHGFFLHGIDQARAVDHLPLAPGQGVHELDEVAGVVVLVVVVIPGGQLRFTVPSSKSSSRPAMLRNVVLPDPMSPVMITKPSASQIVDSM